MDDLSPHNPIDKITKSKPNLPDNQRIAIYSVLLFSLKDGSLPRGIFQKLAPMYNVHPNTIRKIWLLGQKSDLKDFNKIISQKKANCGRKEKNWNLQRIKDIPIEKRRSLSQLSASSGIPKSSLLRLVNNGKIRKNEFCYFYIDPN